MHRLRAQVESMELAVLREVIERGVPAEVGAVDAHSYLIGALTMSPTEAATTVKLAEALGSKLADTGLALAEGLICRDRAKAIVEVVAGLPLVASSEQQVEVEEILLEHAAQLNATQIRKLTKVLEHYLDPDGVQPREETAKAKRVRSCAPTGTGPRPCAGSRPRRTWPCCRPPWSPCRLRDRPRTAPRTPAPRRC
ncbi:MAG TPA: DUF222 domain-containing protein, partial [Sporichthyaceae bacterium]|nr:DUF222 domain-containing protein [Sporichthyaceae bacterium]